jgi:acyl carrier protein
MQQNDILTLVYRCIDEINRQLPPGGKLDKGLDTPLLGDGSKLDSLSLINFIVAFEEELEQTHRVRYNFLEESFLSNPSGPLNGVRSLVEFVQQRQD